MNQYMKRILFIIINVTIVFGMLVLLGFSVKKQGEKKCYRNEIKIKSKNNNHFLEKKDIEKILKRFDREQFKGKSIKEIDILHLEQQLNSIEEVENAQIYLSNNGVLNIKIETRTPILRVINKDGVSYYEFFKENKKYIVSCAVGHLYGVQQKEARGPFPNFEIEWKPAYEKKSGSFTKKYLFVLKKLAKEADEFIVATDFDVEEEVIGWNVIRFICKKKG